MPTESGLRKGGDVGTSPLLVELLIIGAQAAGWLWIVVLECLGTRGVHVATLKDWLPILTVALVGLAYTLGLVLDTLLALKPFRPRRFPDDWSPPRWVQRKTNDIPAYLRNYVMAKNSRLAGDLEQRFNRFRLMRATTANLAAAAVSIAVGLASGRLALVRGRFSVWVTGMVLTGVMSLISVLVSITWKDNYLWNLATAFELVDTGPPAESSAGVAGDRRRPEEP